MWMMCDDVWMDVMWMMCDDVWMDVMWMMCDDVWWCVDGCVDGCDVDDVWMDVWMDVMWMMCGWMWCGWCDDVWWCVMMMCDDVWMMCGWMWCGWCVDGCDVDDVWMDVMWMMCDDVWWCVDGCTAEYRQICRGIPPDLPRNTARFTAEYRQIYRGIPPDLPRNTASILLLCALHKYVSYSYTRSYISQHKHQASFTYWATYPNDSYTYIYRYSHPPSPSVTRILALSPSPHILPNATYTIANSQRSNAVAIYSTPSRVVSPPRADVVIRDIALFAHRVRPNGRGDNTLAGGDMGVQGLYDMGVRKVQVTVSILKRKVT